MICYSTPSYVLLWGTKHGGKMVAGIFQKLKGGIQEGLRLLRWNLHLHLADHSISHIQYKDMVAVNGSGSIGHSTLEEGLNDIETLIIGAGPVCDISPSLTPILTCSLPVDWARSCNTARPIETTVPSCRCYRRARRVGQYR
jgi:hypothetical protein